MTPDVWVCLTTQAKTQTPVFGSSSTFGGATGFGGFAGVEKPEHDAAEGGAEEGTAGEGEEDCSAEFKPLVQLEEVERVSGEEAEDCLVDLCAQQAIMQHVALAAQFWGLHPLFFLMAKIAVFVQEVQTVSV